MIQYFIRRAARRKTMYLGIVTGCILSLLYILINVVPYTDYIYHQSPYTLWIECFTSSVFAELFFFLAPILAAIPMADCFLCDKNSGYLDMIISRGKGKSYFASLFLMNFLIGGLCFLIPVLINIYACFCLLPDLELDIIVGEQAVVSLYGTDTLFPALYYSHPMLHMFLYVFLGGITAGMFANTGLAASFFLKNRLFVWIAPFVIHYIYMALVIAVLDGGARKYLPVNYMRQVSGAGDGLIMTAVLAAWLLIPAFVYIWGVKKRVIY